MSRVLFVYPNVANTYQTCMGIAYLSSYLKGGGHETFLFDCTFDGGQIDFRSMIWDIKPDFICFTALSPDYERAVKLADIAKLNCNAPIIIGGPHVTFLPDEVMKEGSPFDVGVIGEGEEVLLNFINAYSKFDSTTRIAGTWVKRGDVLYKNPIAKLPDISKLPWPDHEMFKRHFEKKVLWGSTEGNYATFMTARGCPFRYAYCYAAGMQDLYKGETYTRYRDIDDVIAEMLYVVQTYDIKSLYIIDETLTTNKKRIIDFCKLYKEVIDIPWHCKVRPDIVDEEIFQVMADSGCEIVMMGIESGVDRIRNGLYNRNLSEEQIINAFKWAKEVGIRTFSFNICGAPTETFQDVRETIELNKKCEVDTGKMTMFTAFPGSEMWNYCKEKEYFFRSGYSKNYCIDSNVRGDDIMPREVLLDLKLMFTAIINGYK